MNAQAQFPLDDTEELIGLPESLWYIVKEKNGYRAIQTDHCPRNAVVGPCDTVEDALRDLNLQEDSRGASKALAYSLMIVGTVCAGFVGYWITTLLFFGRVS